VRGSINFIIIKIIINYKYKYGTQGSFPNRKLDLLYPQKSSLKSSYWNLSPIGYITKKYLSKNLIKNTDPFKGDQLAHSPGLSLVVEKGCTLRTHLRDSP
jgi:hypothetical protein